MLDQVSPSPSLTPPCNVPWPPHSSLPLPSPPPRHTLPSVYTSTHIIIAILNTGGQEAQVGLVHNYMNYEPYTNTWAAKWYLQPVCNTMQYIWGTAVILKYFQTGKFLWQAPVGGKVEFDEGSKPGLDFIGMNYYGRYCRCGHFKRKQVTVTVRDCDKGVCAKKQPPGSLHALCFISA